MGESKHTPRPWQVGNDSGHNPSIIFDADGEAVASVYGLPLHVHAADLGDRDAEALAKAHLIAAAPEMLAALKRQRDNIKRWLETGVPASPEESKSIAGQIDAAIVKAEGRS